MSIDLDFFYFTVLFIIPSALRLSVLIGVGGYGWSSSSNAILIGITSFLFMNATPHSASAAYFITDLIISSNMNIFLLNIFLSKFPK